MKLINLIGLILLFSPPLCSGGVNSKHPGARIHPVFSMAIGGINTSNLGTEKNFPILNPLTDENYTYTPQNNSKTKAMFEFFIGSEFYPYPDWMLQAGIAYAQANTFQVKGTLTQGVDSLSSEQYGYHFNVSLHQLLAQSKLMYVFQESFYPYFLMGLGTSFNKSSNYGTTVPATLALTREYSNNTAHSFTYQLGLGLDTQILSSARLGISYRYVDFGHVSLGSVKLGQPFGEGTLSQSNLYGNEILLQLTYIA
jgi:opacity protein-like surface antigen